MMSDIQDGSRWKGFERNGGIISQPHSTGWLLNTDGVSIFKTMNCSIWPVFLMNMSLSPTMRKDMR